MIMMMMMMVTMITMMMMITWWWLWWGDAHGVVQGGACEEMLIKILVRRCSQRRCDACRECSRMRCDEIQCCGDACEEMLDWCQMLSGWMYDTSGRKHRNAENNAKWSFWYKNVISW
jgi:hypothetical protein